MHLKSWTNQVQGLTLDLIYLKLESKTGTLIFRLFESCLLEGMTDSVLDLDLS